jgi:hypothetical protein
MEAIEIIEEKETNSLTKKRKNLESSPSKEEEKKEEQLCEKLMNYASTHFPGNGYDSLIKECTYLENIAKDNSFFIMTREQFHAMSITAMRHCSRPSSGLFPLWFHPKNKFVVYGESWFHQIVAIKCVAMSKSVPYFKWSFNGLVAESWIQTDILINDNVDDNKPHFVLLVFRDSSSRSEQLCFYFPKTKLYCARDIFIGGGRMYHEPSARPYDIPSQFTESGKTEQIEEEQRKDSSQKKGPEDTFPLGGRKRVFVNQKEMGIYVDWSFYSPTKGYSDLDNKFKASDCLAEDIEAINNFKKDYTATITDV